MNRKTSSQMPMKIDCTKICYRKSKPVALILPEQIVWNRNVPLKGGLLSEKWWKGFMKCHPAISITAAEKLGESWEKFQYKLLMELKNEQYSKMKNLGGC